MEAEAFTEGGLFNRVTRGLFSHLQAAVCRGMFGTHALAGGGRTAPECREKPARRRNVAYLWLVYRTN